MNKKNDPSNGIVGTFEPLGEALLGSEEGDEIDVLIGNHLRRAVVVKVEHEVEQDSDHVRSHAPEHNDATRQRTKSDDEGSVALEPSVEAVSKIDVSSLRISSLKSVIQRKFCSQCGKECLESILICPHCGKSTFDSLPPQKKFDIATEKNNGLLQAPRLDPNAFYDPDYRSTLRVLGVKIIDHFGPVTHKHLCQKIARMHGFQRTGTKIRELIWAAVHNERQTQKDPFGEDIFWPHHQIPQEVLKFRGLEVLGDKRAREHVPYPEKIGLALEAINRRDPLGHMAVCFCLGRLTASTRTELEELIQKAKRVNEKDENPDNC